MTTSEVACDAVFSQSYYIPVDGREENETIAIVTEISDQLDPFCSHVLLTYACYFIYPPCNPDGATGLPRYLTFGCMS